MMRLRCKMGVKHALEGLRTAVTVLRQIRESLEQDTRPSEASED
jgi:hypothetical protein